jgi:hypothetical protein
MRLATWDRRAENAYVDERLEIFHRRGFTETDGKTKKHTPVRILKQLKKHLKRWREDDEKLGYTHVLTQCDGRPLQHFPEHLRPIAEDAGLAHVTLHTLRHTLIARLVDLGLGLIEIANFVGASVATVEKHYNRLKTNGQSRVVEALENRSRSRSFAAVSKQHIVNDASPQPSPDLLVGAPPAMSAPSRPTAAGDAQSLAEMVAGLVLAQLRAEGAQVPSPSNLNPSSAPDVEPETASHLTSLVQETTCRTLADFELGTGNTTVPPAAAPSEAPPDDFVTPNAHHPEPKPLIDMAVETILEALRSAPTPVSGGDLNRIVMARGLSRDRAEQAKVRLKRQGKVHHEAGNLWRLAA